MDYREKLIEFLSEPENMKFLLEIEQRIPEVKEYYYRAHFDAFMQEFIIPKAWEGYKTDVSGDDFKLVEKNGSSATLLCIAIYIGTREENNYYGVIGPPNFDEQSEVQELKSILSGKGMKGRWTHWLAWKYFDRNRSELLSLPLGRPSEEFLEQWAQTFWSFANDIRLKLEPVNMALRASNT